MVNDMLKLTIDQVFPLRKGTDVNKFGVEGYERETNMWEYLV